MNLIERAKNILITPKTEWEVINGETATMTSLLTSYALPLALIPAAAAFLSGILWTHSVTGAIMGAVISLISTIVSFIVGTYVVDLLAPNFKSEKNINKSAQLVAYASTASWVAGIISVIPLLGWLGAIAGAAYTIYLMYLGIGTIKKTPEDQRIVYVIIIVVVIFVVAMIIGALLGGLLLAGVLGTGALGR
jgi:Yip1 domain